MDHRWLMRICIIALINASLVAGSIAQRFLGSSALQPNSHLTEIQSRKIPHGLSADSVKAQEYLEKNPVPSLHNLPNQPVDEDSLLMSELRKTVSQALPEISTSGDRLLNSSPTSTPAPPANSPSPAPKPADGTETRPQSANPHELNSASESLEGLAQSLNKAGLSEQSELARQSAQKIQDLQKKLKDHQATLAEQPAEPKP